MSPSLLTMTTFFCSLLIEMERIERLNNLQRKLSHQYKDISLLDQALTHSSFANERKDRVSNERLEFLGDSVLNLSVTCLLMERFPELKEGELSKLRQGLVRNETLVILAKDIGLGEYLLLGRGEELDGGREKDSILAQTYEALLASIYLDGGIEKVFATIASPLAKILDTPLEGKDFKSQLQEYLQTYHRSLPQYILAKEWGPEHQKLFEVNLLWKGKVLGKGVGRNRKEAEQKAAEACFKRVLGER